MDRRSFLIGPCSAILTAAFYKDVVRYAERKSEPLLIRPKDVKRTLYAIPQGGGYSLWLDNHPDDEPNWGVSWAEFYQNCQGYNWDETIAEIATRHGIGEEDATCYAAGKVDENTLLDWHYDHELGAALAVQFFQKIDLGPNFNTGAGKGEVCFADYRCAGPERWQSEAADQPSLSLLQGRLNELETGIAIEVSHSTIFRD